MRWPHRLIAATMVLAVAPAVAGPGPVYTPVVGSAERAAILKTLHGDDDPRLRITFRQFRVFHDGRRAIAYVEGDGAVGGFQSILTRDGKAAWRNVWGEGGRRQQQLRRWRPALCLGGTADHSLSRGARRAVSGHHRPGA